VLLLSILLAGAATAEKASPDASPYVNARSVEAERVLRRIAGEEPASLKNDEERTKWASARLAWISLARLQGRDEEALKIFGGCAELCGKHGPAGEWKAARAWGCARKPELAFCADRKETKAKK
jgi:hypothetical protein